jgi:hypothetical protein
MLDDAQPLTEIPTGLEPVRDFDALPEMLSEASRWWLPGQDRRTPRTCAPGYGWK